MIMPNSELISLLRSAYNPCPGFKGNCNEMRWIPENGHVPRGYCGATGELSDIQLILVCAEPGDPHPSESHAPYGSNDEKIDSAYSYAFNCFETGKDLFHQNVRKILNLCFPDSTFEFQMRHTWITESVLCSACVESGYVPARAVHECRSRYLEKQINLLSNATVVALGAKARDRLKGIPGVVPAIAAAPPGCNRKDAVASWQKIAEQVRRNTIE